MNKSKKKVDFIVFVIMICVCMKIFNRTSTVGGMQSTVAQLVERLGINGYTKTCVNGHSQKFQDQLSLNAGQKYYRMLSAILLTCIQLPVIVKTFVLSIFEWLFYTGFTVVSLRVTVLCP